MRTICKTFLYAFFTLYGLTHSIRTHIKGAGLPALLTASPVIGYVYGLVAALSTPVHVALIIGAVPVSVVGLRWLAYYKKQPYDSFVSFMTRCGQTDFGGLWLFGTFFVSFGTGVWFSLHPFGPLLQAGFYEFFGRIVFGCLIGLLPSCLAVLLVGGPLLALMILVGKTLKHQARKGKALYNDQDPESVEL